MIIINCPSNRGTKDQHLFDKMILENIKRRESNLNVSWIDFKEAFDPLPYDWIIKCLDIIGVNKNMRSFVQKSMAQWKTQ